MRRGHALGVVHVRTHEGSEEFGRGQERDHSNRKGPHGAPKTRATHTTSHLFVKKNRRPLPKGRRAQEANDAMLASTTLAREFDETLTRDLAPLFAEEQRQADELHRRRALSQMRRTETRAAPREPSSAVALLLGVCGGLALGTWTARGAAAADATDPGREAPWPTRWSWR